MKKSFALILTVLFTLTMVSCKTQSSSPTNDSAKITTTETTTKDTQKSNIAIDNYGYYEDELSNDLADMGTVYFDPTLKGYVLKPRDAYKDLIYLLASDPYDDDLLDLWDGYTDILADISDTYNCCICVANPVSSGKYLLIVGFGDVSTSVF